MTHPGPRRPPGQVRQPIPEAHVSRETSVRLDRFLAFFMRWNERINLTAERDAPTIQDRHVADSLQLLGLISASDGPAADLGTGGGFPGLVLAIAAPDRPWHLVEADRRKAAFLATVVGELDLAHVRIHARRIEALVLPPLAVLTARAFAPLPVLLGHAARLLAPDGVAIFPKGRTAEAELTAVAPDWTMGIERFPSRTDPAATLLRLSGIRRAGP